MKKNLFFLAVAAVALASCSSDETTAENSNVGKNQQKEIAFMPIAQPTTRTVTNGVIDGTTFPDGQDIYVSAYSTATTKDYFQNITFDGDATNKWNGSPRQYWPLAPTTLNFLGITGVPNANITDWATTGPSYTLTDGATITWTHNSDLAATTDMYDLMYAVGQGSVAYGAGAGNENKLVYSSSTVTMDFKHALAQIAFETKVNNASYAASIHIDKIVVKDMITAGTFTLTNNAYTATTAQSAGGKWSSSTTQDTDVPGSNTFASTDMTASYQANGAVVVPCNNLPDGTDQDGSATDIASFSGFDVHFTMNGNSYVYHYTPGSGETTLQQGKKYTYKLDMKLTEILISPVVTDWTTATTTVTVPNE